MHTGTGARAHRAVLSAALLTLATACGGGNGAQNGADASGAPLAVNIGAENFAVAEERQLSRGPTLSGQLVAERSAAIRAEVASSVVRIHHEQGDRVAAGTVLARLDDSAIRDAWLSARSGVTAAETLAAQAEREVQRAQRLHAAGAIADRDVEGARNAKVAAEAQLADATARLAAAQKQLDATEVKAPFAGIVSERQVSAGDVVAPGAPLFTVVDPASLRLEGAVPAASIGDVRTGLPVRFTISGFGTRTFDGRVTNINPAADPGTGQVRIYAAVPNTGGQLVAGLFAEGRVTSATHTGLAVPPAAIDQRGLRPFVVRLRGGQTERLVVTVGIRDDEQGLVEISGGGVAAGDTLLLGAAQGITPGTPVRVSAPRKDS
jgi:membrane fusion protein (multidrug efflux system)